MALNPAVLKAILGIGAGVGVYGGNMLTSAINSKRAYKYAVRAMEYQDQLNRAYTRDSYGLMRQGLVSAGYNPLLALDGSANSAMPSAGGVNADSDSGSQAITSAIDAGRLQNETQIAEKQKEKIEAEKDKIEAETRDINNKPRNIITNEVRDILDKGYSPILNSAVSRLKSSKLFKKVSSVGLALKDIINDSSSAISSRDKVYKLKATYNDYHTKGDNRKFKVLSESDARRYLSRKSKPKNLPKLPPIPY